MKKFKLDRRKILLLLLCLLILQEILPMTSTEASGLRLYHINDSRGDNMKTYVLQANGDLVTWARGMVTGNGKLLPIYPYFYLARRTAARHVISFSGWSGAIYYVDENHVLWKKSDEDEERVKLMEDVEQTAAAVSYAFAVKTDGSLWSWGNNSFGHLGLGWEDGQIYLPQKIADNIQSVCILGDALLGSPFAITKDGMLLHWGSKPDSVPEPVTENVKAVSMLAGYLYQYLTPQGEVYTLPLFFENTKPGRIAEDVYEIFDGGVIKNDHTQWLWDGDEEGGELVQVRKGVQTAADGTFYADTYGRLHCDSKDWTLPALPRSVRSLNTTLRNLFLLVLTYNIWQERRQKNACREVNVSVEDLDWMQ